MTGQIELSSPFNTFKCYEADGIEQLTVWDHFNANNLEGQIVVCSFNEEPLLRKDWDNLVTDNDIVKFIVLPQGGENGGAKGILRIVILIVIMIFAWYIAPFLAPLIGLSVNVVATGIIIVGSLLVNALLPPVSPEGNANGQQKTSADSTYSIGAQGNTAKLLETIPKIYGRHLFYPDFASQPWIDYVNNDQYLYQLFCLGLGKYNLHQLRIEDTVLWDENDGLADTFSDVEFEVVPPGIAVTLFPAAVVSAIEVTGQSFEVVDEYIGPFTANAAGTATNKIAIDIVFPRGIYYASSESGKLWPLTISMVYEAREIDYIGEPVSDWIILDSPDFTAATATAQRYSREYLVSPSRYEVRVKRTTTFFTDTAYGNAAQWGGLRAFIPDDNIFENVTTLAVKMRATNQLSSQSSRKFNVVQTALIPIYDGMNWMSDQPTQNPVWATLDVLRNQIYGTRISDDRIDLPAFLALAQTFDARGDTFNGIFSNKETVWSAISTILRVGRAQPLMIAGVVSCTRDEPALIVRGMFTPANIKRNTFEANYVLYDDNAPDAVIVEFFDESTWSPNEILCKLPDSTADSPARISLFGCTNRLQAWREGIYQAAVNLYRRVFVTITTEMEGRLLVRGDAAVISHDLPSWGQSAIVMDWNVNTKTLTLSESIIYTAGDVIGMNDRQGKLWGPVIIDSTAEDGYQVILNSVDLASVESEMGTMPVYYDYDEEHTRVSIGSLSNYTRAFKLASAFPNDMNDMTLIFTNDDPRVYEADQGEPPEELDPYGPGVIPVAPIMSNLYVNQDPLSLANPISLNASWSPASGADFYIIQTSSDGIIWSTIYQGTINSCSFTASTGTLYIRGVAIGILQGPWAYPYPNPVNYTTPNGYPTQPQLLAVTITQRAQYGGLPDYEFIGFAYDINVSWMPGLRSDDYTINLYSDSMTPGEYDQLEDTNSTTSPSTIFLNGADTLSTFMIEVICNNSVGSGPENTLIYGE